MPDEPYLAEIMYIAGGYAPRGWATCDGQTLQVSQNQALFSLLGTAFGGDGQTTFKLPDLRGRAPLGTVPSNTPAPGAVAMGTTGGEESHTLSTNEMPGHTHNVQASATQPGSNNSNLPTSSASLGQSAGNQNGQPFALNIYSSQLSAPAALASSMIGNAGGGQGHENRQPYTVLTACIALLGIYPSRA